MSLAPQTPFQWLVTATDPEGGLVPAAGYLVKWYSAGTSTPKTIYTDPELLVPYPAPSNTAELNADGRALIYLGPGGYKMVVCEPDGTPVYTQDDINGEGSFGTGFVSSFAALADVNPTINPFCYISGYYNSGDGGEGMFYAATSGAAADGGYVQDSNVDPTKKWFRIPDENGDVRAASFGYIPATAGDQTSALIAADSYAFIHGARLRIQAGGVATVTTLTLTAPVVVFNPTANLLAATGTVNLTVDGIVEAGADFIFNNFDSVSLSSKQETRPEWFGSSTGNSGAANVTAFAAWVAAGGGVFVVPPGTWPHTGPFTPSSTAITIFLGSVGTRVPGTYYGPASLLSGNLSLTITGTYGLTGNLTVTGDILGTGNLTRTGNITLTGGVNISGNVVVGQALSVGTTIDAVGDVTTSGSVYAQAGTSGLSFRAAGSGNIDTGTGDVTLPANALLNADEYIHIICAGSSSNAAPTATVTVGGATVFSTAILAGTSATNYIIHVWVFRTGATTSYSTGYAIMNGIGTNINAASDTRTASITWANSNTITHSYSGATKALTMFEIYPHL